MKAIFYNIDAPTNFTYKLNASPSTDPPSQIGKEIPIIATENISSTDMTLRISINDFDHQTSVVMFRYNYCDMIFIEHSGAEPLHAYYYVTDWKVTGKIGYVSLHIDVLSTYRDYITIYNYAIDRRGISRLSLTESQNYNYAPSLFQDNSILVSNRHRVLYSQLGEDLKDFPNSGFSESNDKILLAVNADNIFGTMGCTQFINIFVPTYQNLNDLQKYLWSQSFFDTISKILNNPMDAIISLKMSGIAPPTSNDVGAIHLGNATTGIVAPYLERQFQDYVFTFDTITPIPNEFFYYEPYSYAELFLPFIGVVPFNISHLTGNVTQGTAETQKSLLKIKYRVDFLSGNVVAQIIKTDNLLADVPPDEIRILNQYQGNCMCNIPYSSSISGVSAAALNVLSGNTSISAIQGNVYSSSSLNGNAGYMSYRHPQLIMYRPSAYEQIDLGFHSNSRMGNDSIILDTLNTLGRAYLKFSEINFKINDNYINNRPDPTKNMIDELNQIFLSGIVNNIPFYTT